MPEYFDIHSHLNFGDLATDLQGVLSRMKEGNVWTTVVGTDKKTSIEAIELAEKEEGVFACIGVHPVDDPLQTFEVSTFESLVMHPKVVAIGECGLDYYRLEGDMITEKERQSALFRSQIEFALKHNKALMIHSRSAYDDLITILGEYKKTNPELFGNVHFFSGNTEQAIALAGLGFTLSFAGPITFAREYDDAIRAIPSTMIHAETDSPYATPVPFRGKRNEPLYVSHIAKKLAEIRGEDEDAFKKTLVENAFRLFNIRL